jgi:hypothetical protein
MEENESYKSFVDRLRYGAAILTVYFVTLTLVILHIIK